MRVLCSPYSVTVFVSCPQDGRVTVKADLVFEDFVGLDVHRKHVLSREVRSRMTQSNGNELYAPSYSLPKEIHIIDDDRNTKSKVITDAQDLGETNETLSSAPSFNLLQEEIGEDVFIPEAGETECKSKTEERIFDRIRKKSKSFPTLLSSKAMASSYQPLILKRKCPQENHFELDQSDVHVDDVVLIEEECNETSLKFRGAVETVEQDDGRFSGISNILYDGLRGNRFGQSDTSKLYDNLVNYIQAVRCKTAFPIESDPIPDRQDCHDQKEAPFCGFTSVFSFL